MAEYTFGCAAVTGKPDWLVQSSSKNNQAQEALALDNVGEPIVAHYYSKVSEMSFSVIIPDGESSMPEIGDVFSYEDKQWYVASAQITETNTDFRRYELSCKRFLAHGLPSNS